MSDEYKIRKAEEDKMKADVLKNPRMEVSEKDSYEREQGREIIFSISEAISSIRDKQDLLHIILEKLKIFLHFSDISISLYNIGKQTYKPFLNDCPTMNLHPDFTFVATSEYPIQDNIHNVIIAADGPVVFSVNKLMEQPLPHIVFMHQAGIRELACIKLLHNSEKIGALVLLAKEENSFSQNQLNFIQEISHHLATAVSNIVAFEEIRVREVEKTILLSLSNEIAAVRNRDDLFLVVSAKVKELFSVQGFGIALISEDEKTHTPFLLDVEDHIGGHADFKKITTQKYSATDGVFDVVMNSNEPVAFTVSEFQEETGLPAYVKFWKDMGIQSILGMRLRVSENNLGCLFFHLESHLINQLRNNLLKGVCAQISIALSHILSNEKIARQLEEISRYKEQLEEEKLYLQEEVSSGSTFSDIIGNGVEMQKVFHQLSQVSFANSTVLLLGETGTGKELIARAIHNSSPRKDKLMVKVNCAALPANLVESELFGHERGSFTGAVERRIGKFELANQGTLFLDEIGEMTIDLQVKLLRAIQEKEIERVGGKATIKTDVRIIAATSRDLQKEVEEGRFRRDLYYRLNVFPIVLPPLRDRKEDIPVLVSHFIGKYAKTNAKKITDISGKAMKELQAYSWPGNVRELEHLIERSILTTVGNMIREIHLPINKREALKHAAATDYVKTHEENERDYIIDVLNNCKGKIFGTGGAAEILNLNVSTLNSKIKKLGIKKEKSFYKKGDAALGD
jgi:formate hydrogenlyase transcriptional activator